MATSNFPTYKIMLVEDDPSQARFLAHMLIRESLEDVEIVTFINPSQALSYVNNNRIDILITDLDMPAVSGLTLIERVKQNNGAAQCLLMTAVSTSDSLVAACDLGTTDYLLKPVEQRELVAFVRQSLERLSRWRLALTGTLKRSRALRS